MILYIEHNNNLLKYETKNIDDVLDLTIDVKSYKIEDSKIYIDMKELQKILTKQTRYEH